MRLIDADALIFNSDAVTYVSLDEINKAPYINAFAPADGLDGKFYRLMTDEQLEKMKEEIQEKTMAEAIARIKEKMKEYVTYKNVDIFIEILDVLCKEI